MLAEIVNKYGEKHSPYTRNLVNHLPMGQLAYYKLTNNLEELERYSKEYRNIDDINPVKSSYPKKESLEECLGNRELYESSLDIIRERSKDIGIENLLSKILNTYDLGISSGIFHTLIRLAYGVEGYQLDKGYQDEIERGLAYYITGYQEAKLLIQKKKASNIIVQMNRLIRYPHIKDLIDNTDTVGQGIQALYRDEKYLKDLGFTLEGREDEKIRALLKLLIPTYYHTGNIVALHCITSIHALIVLKEYFKDFNRAIDILTTSIITHLLSSNIRDYKYRIDNSTGLSWDCVRIKGSRSPDVHAIKLTYSALELNKIYKIPELKDIALRRIRYR